MSASFVAFHGTSAANAESIHQEGFRAGTYFAFDVKDAIAFGLVLYKILTILLD